MAQAPQKPGNTPAGDADTADTRETLELLGGRICLDFINTVDPRVGQTRRDYLSSYADLARWAGQAEPLAPDQVATLLRAAAREPQAAGAVFVRAIALRETLYRVFVAAAAGTSPAPADLAALHAAYLETMARAYLVADTASFVWQWPEGEPPALDALLWPIVRSAVELLTAPELRRVRVCPGAGDCGWLFLDTSKSGRRRWCSMESCGSRIKMRRYYARTHEREQARTREQKSSD